MTAPSKEGGNDAHSIRLRFVRRNGVWSNICVDVAMTAPVRGSLESTTIGLASGEWVARKCDFDDGLVTIAHCGEWRVCVETGIKGGNYRDWDGGSDEAHARLFAAAPDLLVACEAALHDRMFKDWPEIATLIKNAIAKATGQ